MRAIPCASWRDNARGVPQLRTPTVDSKACRVLATRASIDPRSTKTWGPSRLDVGVFIPFLSSLLAK